MTRIICTAIATFLLVSCTAAAPKIELGACTYTAVNMDSSMAMCLTRGEDLYSFAESAVGMREGYVGETANGPDFLAWKAIGIDIDARCMISVVSDQLNWNDMPKGNDHGRMNLVYGKNRKSVAGFYNTTNTPKKGGFTAMVKCDVLRDIFLAESVTLSWSTKTDRYSFTASDESVSGFRDALAAVTASARSRRKD